MGVFRRRRPIRLARTRSSVADVGTGGLRSWATAASAAIQRGPSRLYRLNEQPSTQSLMLLPGVTAHPRRSRSFRDLKMSPERSDSSFTTESVDPVSPAVSASLSCCGPEFIVKNNLLPHIITLSHPPKKVGNNKIILQNKIIPTYLYVINREEQWLYCIWMVAVFKLTAILARRKFHSFCR